MLPTVEQLLMSNSSHPLRASALADGHKGRTLRSAEWSHPASADKVSDVVNIGKFMKKY